MKCLLKTWPKSNPSRGHAKRLGPAMRAHLAGVALLFALAFLLPALSVCADTAIHIVSTRNSYVFSESLTFAVEADT